MERETTRAKDIQEFVTESLIENNIEATDENTLMFLRGMQDTWKDIPTDSTEEAIEKSMYGMALSGMIFKLEMKALFNRPPFV